MQCADSKVVRGLLEGNFEGLIVLAVGGQFLESRCVSNRVHLQSSLCLQQLGFKDAGAEGVLAYNTIVSGLQLKTSISQYAGPKTPLRRKKWLKLHGSTTAKVCSSRLCH